MHRNFHNTLNINLMFSNSEVIRKLLNKRGLKLTELAEKAEIKYGSLLKMMKNDNYFSENLKKIANALDVSYPTFDEIKSKKYTQNEINQLLTEIQEVIEDKKK